MKHAFPATVLLVLIALSGIVISCTTTQSPSRQVDDAKITTEVKSKLASDLHVASVTNIEVNTTNGIVTLAGQVKNDQIKTRAEEITRNVNGVVGVNNNLQVEPSTSAQRGETYPPPR